MEQVSNNYLLIIIGIVAITAELFLGVSTGFDLLVVGVILLTAGGVGLLMQSFFGALLTAIIFSIGYMVFGRKLIRQKIAISTKTTNTDALIGKVGVVITKIDPSAPGQIKVEGEIWRAEAKSAIDVGNMVTVQSVSGVTLTVAPAL